MSKIVLSDISVFLLEKINWKLFQICVVLVIRIPTRSLKLYASLPVEFVHALRLILVVV
jgi:hypothetical protein